MGAANVEIKARVQDLEQVEHRARRIATEGPMDLSQDDTFFACASGRLKLRELAPDRGELIHYCRPDAAGPKVSDYLISATTTPAVLRESLARALGIIGRVKKQRRLYVSGRTRIHLDTVAGLGTFVELEVVMREGEPVDEAQAEARRLMEALGIGEDDLVEGAYLDLQRP